jgi:predicted CXXCH cytochrome family protein
MRLSRLLWLFAAIPFAAGIWLLADWWVGLPEGATAEYVGREACASCHPKETELWSGSDHDRAMDLATPETVLGDFHDRQLEHFGVVSRMFRREDGAFCVATDNRQGKLETFVVKYVLGYRPLQQYLVEFADGRVQCLPVAWDTVGKRWFHLYPDEPIPHTDPLHWTGPMQTWNYMCAECHTTNLRKNYRLADNTYRTEFSEIDVSCETCHGPGSLHVRLAESWSPFWDRRLGYGLARLKAPDHRVQIDTCASCHARRRIVYPDFRPGGKFLDHYMPQLLETNLYFADGQILDEVFEYGSFVQSKMFHQGVRCTDCHDPHSTAVKFATPQTRGRFADNRLCGQCHLPTKYDVVGHHHHPDGSKRGSACVECHMPDRYYMVVDPRRDHSFRIPRPDLTVALGIPNACNGCHHDAAKGETAQWAAEQVEKWYGKKKELPHFAFALDAGRHRKPGAVEVLVSLVERPDTRAIVRGTAVALLGEYPDEAAFKAIIAQLDHPEGIVRAAAVRALEMAPADELYPLLVPRLNDPLRAVRTEAARLLTRLPSKRFSEKDRAAFDQALAEYVVGQQALSDQPGAHLNLGVVYANLGRLADAEQEYQAALAIDPDFVPARINLAMLYDQKQDKGMAEKQFRAAIEALRRQLDNTENLAKTVAAAAKAAQRPAANASSSSSPRDGDVYVPVFADKATANDRSLEHLLEQLRQQLGETHYSLGLLLAEDEKRLDEAAKVLAVAARFLPRNARVFYNFGLAQQKLGQAKAAEESLITACRLDPSQPDYVHALTVYYSQSGDWGKARVCAEQLVRLAPANPAYRALLEMVQRQGK